MHSSIKGITFLFTYLVKLASLTQLSVHDRHRSHGRDFVTSIQWVFSLLELVNFKISYDCGLKNN